MFWVNLSLNNLSNYPYLSHTLQTFKDLFDPKCCALPTLVESDMSNKPMAYTHHVSERSPFHSSSSNSIQTAIGYRGKTTQTHLRTLV